MSRFKVDFYREVDGSKPLGAFIRALDAKMKAKVVAKDHHCNQWICKEETKNA